jgi:tRNA A-37 threonylcarbamoyl transferase component Bud32
VEQGVVSLRSITAGATLVVSSDGSTPTCDHSGGAGRFEVYHAQTRGSSGVGGWKTEGVGVELVVNATCFLKARACREGLTESELVASGQFNVLPPSPRHSAWMFLCGLVAWSFGGGMEGEGRGGVICIAVMIAIAAGLLSVACLWKGGRGARVCGRVEGERVCGEGRGELTGSVRLKNVGGKNKSIHMRRGAGAVNFLQGGGRGGGKVATVEDRGGHREGEDDGEGARGRVGVDEGRRGKESSSTTKAPLTVTVPAERRSMGDCDGNESNRRWLSEGEEEVESLEEEGRGGLLSPASVPVPLGAGVVRIGPMQVQTNSILGLGSHGTVVYRGRLHGRCVAIKRVLLEFVRVAEKEMDLLIRSDRHCAIVRYFDRARDGAFVYLALELCACNLFDLVEYMGGKGTRENKAAAGSLELELRLPESMRELVDGIAFLHSLGIVHRDIKPLNILVTHDSHLKISDMGLSKRLDAEQSSFETLAGTWGWRAPEQVRGERSTRSVDLFACGCVIFFSCTLGAHPFGPRASREANILAARHDLSKLKHDPVASQLISSLLEQEPSNRPAASALLRHPFFWSALERLEFLVDVSDHLEPLTTEEALVQDFEARAVLVFGQGGVAVRVAGDGVGGGGSWDAFLSKELLADLVMPAAARRKYKFDSLRDLLRAVRNKKNHFVDLPALLQIVMGPLPHGYLAYWTDRFPALFMQVHDFVVSNALHSEPRFLRYFGPD